MTNLIPIDDFAIRSGNMREVADTLRRLLNAIDDDATDLDELKIGYGPKSFYWRDSALSIPDTGTTPFTAIPYDAVDYDTDGIQDSSATTKFEAKTSGRYTVLVQVQFAINSTGDRLLFLQKNGAPGSGSEVSRDIRDANAAKSTTLFIDVQVDLLPGDFLEAYVGQNSSGAVSLRYLRHH